MSDLAVLAVLVVAFVALAAVVWLCEVVRS
jgi:hypothetical protein